MFRIYRSSMILHRQYLAPSDTAAPDFGNMIKTYHMALRLPLSPSILD